MKYLAFLLAIPTPVFPQAVTGSLLGSVSDPSGATINAASFGQVLGTLANEGERQIQLGLRLQF